MTHFLQLPRTALLDLFKQTCVLVLWYTNVFVVESLQLLVNHRFYKKTSIKCLRSDLALYSWRTNNDHAATLMNTGKIRRGWESTHLWVDLPQEGKERKECQHEFHQNTPRFGQAGARLVFINVQSRGPFSVVTPLLFAVGCYMLSHFDQNQAV